MTQPRAVSRWVAETSSRPGVGDCDQAARGKPRARSTSARAARGEYCAKRCVFMCGSGASVGEADAEVAAANGGDSRLRSCADGAVGARALRQGTELPTHVLTAT